ncbi:MAG: tetraacyldisaccharide 4'-kinase [Pelistega sp.]|nr:tetraacyldisaccharide 4'-kinase [Pelistega sp.]
MSSFFSQAIQKSWLTKGTLNYLLLPLSKVAEYFAEKKRHAYLSGQKKTYKAPVPVIVVGNIFIGGTGKTPLTLALVDALKQRGYTPGIISRGYGVQLGEFARFADLSQTPAVLPHQATAETLSRFIGDEPSLLAQVAPIAVHPTRAKAVECLLQNNAHIDVIISDDGLQHYALARDIEIVVQDARGVGNGWMLPAGPLREPISRLQSVDFVVTNDTHLFQQSDTQATLNSTKPQSIAMQLALVEFEHLRNGQRLPLADFLAQYQQHSITAIAGIGNPNRFFQSLTAAGIKLTQQQAFSDHHHFSPEDLSPYHQGLLLMTSKDAIKCQTFAQDNWWVAHVKAQFKPDNFFDVIHQQLTQLSR